MPTPKPAIGIFPNYTILISLIALILIISCKKIDQLVVREKPVVTLETRFFTEHAPKDTLVRAVLGFVKRENETHQFVNNLIKKIGYPYWDKAIVKRGGSRSNGRSTSDSTNTVFIPFVLDNANTVNNTLIVITNPSDTNFLLLADWQYANQSFGPPSVDSTAENVALLFMLEDKNVFGYDRFTITDSNLFRTIPTSPNYNGREIRFPASNARTLLEYEVEVCFTTYVCTTPNYCSDGCDYVDCILTTDKCHEIQTGCFFYIYSVDEGQWSTGGGGGPEGGGSSGGGSGPAWNSWDPPICEEEPQGRSTTYQNCGPGWTPPGIDIPVEIEDPCSAGDITSGTNATSNYTVLSSTVAQFTPFDPNSTTQEEQYFIVNNNNGTYTPGPIQSTSTSGGVMQGVTSNTVMVVHTHPYGPSNAFPSASDFFELADFGSNFLMHYVIAANGTKYAMVVNDYTLLQNFVNANPGAIGSSGNFNLNTPLGVQWVVLRNKLQTQGYSLTEATERSYAHIMKQAGVTLVKAPVASDTFKKIGIKQKTDVAGTPLVDSSGYPLYENADCN